MPLTLSSTITDYYAWQLSLPIPWLTGGDTGQAYSQIYGSVLNTNTDTWRSAIKVRMPLETPSDGLPYIAEDRKLIQGITETEDEFRIRLQEIWQTAPAMGQTVGVLLQLYYQGYQDAYIISSTGLIQNLNNPLNTDSYAFPWDQLITNYSQQNILLPPDSYTFNMPIRSYINPTPPSLWDYQLSLSSQTGIQQNNRYIIFFYNAPAVWTGGIPSDSQLNIIQSIVNDWGPAAGLFEGIIVGNNQPQIGINWILGTSTMSGSSYSSYLSNVY